MIAKINYTNK